MPRIAGIDIPDHKKIYYSVQSIYGVGKTVATLVMKQSNIDPDKRARELNPDEINRLQRALENYMVEGNLRRKVNENIQRLQRIKSYRGLRHTMKLPTRGQRTKVNGRTARGMSGKRNTIGSVSKESAAAAAPAKK